MGLVNDLITFNSELIFGFDCTLHFMDVRIYNCKSLAKVMSCECPTFFVVGDEVGFEMFL